MLDVGEELEPDCQDLRRRLGSLEPDLWHADDRREFIKRATGTQAEGKKPFGSDILFRDPVGFFGNGRSTSEFQLKPSFAKGGLSNGWGAAVLPYRSQDIESWPIDIDDLAPHYQAVAAFMPIAARLDDLQDMFPAHPIRDNQPLALSSQAARLVRRLEKRKSHLRDLGIYFGQARQAASAACHKCAMCLYGCPYDFIYDTTKTIRALERHGGLRYVRGHYVTEFDEQGESVSVRGYDPMTRARFEVYGAKVFIAAGVLPTAKIVLNTIAPGDHTVTLKDSQHFFLPLLHTWWPKPDPALEKRHTLTQLFIELADSHSAARAVHFQLYTYNDFFAKDMRERLGKLSRGLGPLVDHISRRLIVAQGFLHSDESASVKIRRCDASAGAELDFAVVGNTRSAAAVQRSIKRMRTALMRSGLVALNAFCHMGAVGSSFHCGGTFPMSAEPGPLQTDTMGRLHGFTRSFIVDASVFSSVPATTITFSVMANAHRIAAAAAQT